MRTVGPVDRAAVRCSSRSGGKPSRGSRQPLEGYYGGQGGHGHQVWQQYGPFDRKVPRGALRRQTPKLIKKGTKAAAAEAAVTAAEAIAVVDLEETNRRAAEFKALGGGALAMALAQEAEPGDPLRECWHAHGLLQNIKL